MKKLSTHAATAKAIRQELKTTFPSTVFKVTSQTFAGGNSVNIEWTNGPTSACVNKIVGKYQYGYFDCMTDCYDITNSRNDIPQVKYLQARREVSEDIKQALFEECRKTYAGWENLTSMDECSEELKKHWSAWTARDYIYRLTIDKDLTHSSK
jgi:hypothetical protein